MKQTLITAALGLALAAQSHAAILLAAYDFNGTSDDYDGNTFESAYTDIPQTGIIKAPDGSNDFYAGDYSSISFASASSLFGPGNNGTTNLDIVTRVVANQLSTSEVAAVQYFNGVSTGSFSITVDVGAGRSIFDLVLSASIASPLGSNTDTIALTGDAGYSSTLTTTAGMTYVTQTSSTALSGIDNAAQSFTFTFNAGAGSTFNLDNIQIYGELIETPVPEPSAYATLAGVLTLAFVALRRRRK